MKQLNQDDLLRIYVGLKNYQILAMFNSQKKDIQTTIEKVELLLDEESKRKVFRWGEI